MALKYNYWGNIRAPEFPADLEWLNTDKPLTLAALRGKFVLLDFWTYGCINCMHVIPDLKTLEARYPRELVVIGVHSAKFANEGDLRNIRQIILRYELEHPVVNDREFRVWQAYVVRAWPTTVLIDPRGYVLAAHSGEGVLAAYSDLLASAIREYDAKGLLDRSPLELAPESAGIAETTLSFPGKVLADEARQRLFIADSNHHRIVMTDLNGQVLEVIGSGERGLRDGPFAEAAFAKPQGMALNGDKLYIADTENHALRLVDLGTLRVRTLAGNGGMAYSAPSTAPAQAQLNSPWDLALVGRKLYIAMAGRHQIWMYDLDREWIGPYAGNGREALLDGSATHASLAQPSGLTSDGKMLYLADSEASAVRSCDLEPGGRVRTIIGAGLFDFGDVDGVWPTARLQHPLGVTWYRGVLYVADTYNHKIKAVDPAASSVSTIVGAGQPGWKDGSAARFYEPGGLSGANGKLYVADTNNHVIRMIHLDTNAVETLRLADPRGLLARRRRRDRGQVVVLDECIVRIGPGMIRIQFDLPHGHAVNEIAPSVFEWVEAPDHVRIAEQHRLIRLAGPTTVFEIPAEFAAGRGLLRGEVTLYHCTANDQGACLVYRAQVELPIVALSDAPATCVSATIVVPSDQPEKTAEAVTDWHTL